MIWYINGVYREPVNVELNINNSGFLHGYGVFTTFLFTRNNAYNLKMHTDRLKDACKRFNIHYPEFEFSHILNKLADMNNMDRLRIRILLRKALDSTTVIITADEFQAVNRSFRLVTCKEPRHANPLNKYKTTNYMLPLYYKQQALDKGFDDMLFYDIEGNILETCFANIFLVRNRHIYTPASTLELLPGITRRLILERKVIDNYKILEAQISLNKLAEYESVFLTNAVHGIIKVESIDDIIYKPCDFDFRH